MRIPKYTTLLALALLLPCLLAAQQLDHVLGDAILKIRPGADIYRIAHDVRQFEGQDTKIRVVRALSPQMQIWQVHFNFKDIHEARFVQHLGQHPDVLVAQPNRLVSERAVPNDPQFPQQWQYINTGQSGGTAGADIDMELAWDVTTGGVTMEGDTIVVCVVDDGLDLTHQDFGENLWVNHEEIPNNGIDDDLNGYVDDVNGWNTYDNNNDIGGGFFGGGHGTPVAGIVGARGNNSLGVSGVNWHVKLMIVVGGGDEANSIASYNYAYVMRQRYNETNGQSGAFVVATNSSWGTDFADPLDYPLWCAFYDSLGHEGILSAGATINGNVNVDVQGDMPTGCASDYLISVTNMNHFGNKVNQAGFGINSVDLGAFGEGTFTAAFGNGYGGFGGTSGATPHVAGSIALLYAAPCPSIIALAKSDPAAAALQIKQYILQGVTPSASLQGITVTGGRLNVNNSMDLLMDNCDFSGCYPAYAVSFGGITDTQASVTWSVGDSVSSVNLRYRMLGSAAWTSVNNLTANSYAFTGLQACSTYEVQFQSICPDSVPDFGGSHFFHTDGCCTAPAELTANVLNDSTVALTWEYILAANSFDIRHRPVGSTTWIVSNVDADTTNSLTINDLIPCTVYELEIRSVCGNGNITDYAAYGFATTGCGACTDLTYCASNGEQSDFEWLEAVSLNGTTNTSGDNGGYALFETTGMEILMGVPANMTLTPGFNGFAFTEYFSVYIDYNQNGSFEDAGELAFQTLNGATGPANTSITAPGTAIPGQTRMRVIMQFGGLQGACGEYGFGETEDYCINIVSPAGCLAPFGISASTVADTASIVWQALPSVQSVEIQYRPEGSTAWQSLTSSSSPSVFSNLMDCTPYEYRLRSLCADGETSDYSGIFNFTSKNCGACTDLPYCENPGGSVVDEWIDTVLLNTLYSVSGPNDGYAFIDTASTTLTPGDTYVIFAAPGYSNFTYNEYFRAWLDLDQDGNFEEEELILSADAVTSMVSDTFTIPLDALEGTTRLRVVMHFGTAPPDACTEAFFGEVEDYCISIGDGPCAAPNIAVGNISASSATMSWNPSANQLGYEYRYRKAGTEPWTSAGTTNNSVTLSNLEECTSYEYQIRSICTEDVSDFSGIGSFITTCTSASGELPDWLGTASAFPNPFQQQLTLDLNLRQGQALWLSLSDAQGRQVQRAYLGFLPAGPQRLPVLEQSSLPAGLYFLQIQAADGSRHSFKVLSLAD